MADADSKVCPRCGVEKPATDFGADRSKSDGRKCYCRPCHNAANRDVRRKHPDKAAAWSAKWQRQNPDKARLKRLRHRERVGPEYFAKKCREWRERNPERARQVDRDSTRNRRKHPRNRLRDTIGNGVLASLRNGRVQPGAFRHLDFTLEELQEHLARQFLPGMSWENMGEWHIDHIVPVSAFNITGVTCDDFNRAWALTNLRPLWAKDNLQKHAKITHLI